MNLEPIINDLYKLSFTMPGIEPGDLIKVDDVILVLRNHLEFYEQKGSALISFPNGKLVERTLSGNERVIATVRPQSVPVKEFYAEKEETEDQATDALPPEILAALGAMGPSAVDKQPSSGSESEEGAAPL